MENIILQILFFSCSKYSFHILQKNILHLGAVHDYDKMDQIYDRCLCSDNQLLDLMSFLIIIIVTNKSTITNKTEAPDTCRLDFQFRFVLFSWAFKIKHIITDAININTTLFETDRKWTRKGSS